MLIVYQFGSKIKFLNNSTVQMLVLNKTEML